MADAAAIETLKRELDYLIEKDADAAEVYEISVKLDKLIAEYYYERGYNGKNSGNYSKTVS